MVRLLSVSSTPFCFTIHGNDFHVRNDVKITFPNDYRLIFNMEMSKNYFSK